MTGAWGLALQILLPIPTVFLLLLSIPGLPRNVRRVLLDAVDKVLSVEFLSTIKLGQFLLAASGILFAMASYKYFALQPYDSASSMQGPSPLKVEYLAMKWRLERNFWLSAFCFTMWFILNRFFTVSLRLVQLEDANYSKAPSDPQPGSELAKALSQVDKNAGKPTADMTSPSVPSRSHDQPVGKKSH